MRQGLYHCFNIVTDQEGTPSAVLIRALQLESGPAGMDRCQGAKLERIAAGPGKLCRAMQIDRSLNACILQPGQPQMKRKRTIDWQRSNLPIEIPQWAAPELLDYATEDAILPGLE